MTKTDTRPTVAVIIPFYNGAKWIERAIKSVLEQTVAPDEFVIVNDGSKPEERAALDPLAKRYGFSIIDKENGGQGSARNAGVAATKSDFISLLDQDDKYLPMHIEDLLSIIPERDPRLGYVYADLCEGDEDGSIVHTNMLRQQVGMHPKRGHIASMLRNDFFVLPSASLISRKAFNEIGGFDPQFMGYEDDDLFLRMFRAGYTNYFLDKPVTVWCIHRGSTSWSVKMSRSRFRYFEKLCHLYPDDEEKEIFYFRDCFIPRFADNFIDDALSAAAKETKDAVELLQILKRFGEMVCANRSVKDEYKLLILRIIDVVETGAISRAHYGKYQRSVQELYQSTSWRATRPFRSLCNVLRGIPGAADVVPDSEDGARSLFDHLVQSNSWKLSAPVRITKRAVTFFGAGGNVGNQFQTRRIEGPTVR